MIGSGGGRDRLVLSRRAALLQAGREQRALRQRLSCLRRAARRVQPDRPLPICEAFFQARRRNSASRSTPTSTASSQEGLGYYQLTQPTRAARRPSVAYLNPIRDRKNLTIALGTQALRIVIERGRAIGVEIVESRQRGADPARRRAKLSSRRARSARRSCCMHSGIGPADHLRVARHRRGARSARRRRRTCRTISTCS